MDNMVGSAVPKGGDPCERLLQFFSYSHLPKELQDTSAACYHLAEAMLRSLPHNAELTVGLRKLLEAKDCFVRAQLFK